MAKKLFKTNLIFIFIFLNIWDFVVNRSFFNGMAIGFIMFGPSTLLWFIGKHRAAALITLISIFEFMMMAIFVSEGFGIGGLETTLKSIFWVPYLFMAGINGFFGLRVYSKGKHK